MSYNAKEHLEISPKDCTFQGVIRSWEKGDTENWIKIHFIICSLHQIFLDSSNEEGWMGGECSTQGDRYPT